MSNYGSSLYGLNYYGTSVTAGTAGSYYSSNLTAEHLDYRKIKLSWDSVSPLSSSETIYAWKIVKTVGGAPDYPNSAPIVRSDTNLTSDSKYIVVGNSFTDTDTVFPAGVIVTYSLWILVGADTSTRNWLNVGSADAIIVEDDNDTTYRLLKLLPNVWTSKSGDALGEPDVPVSASDEATDIYTFLKNFGFYYDKLRAEVKAISNISDYRVYPHKLLPYAVTSLGFSYEPSLGDNYHRSLYRSGNIINSLKGTRLGLQKYVKALTNFDANITIGKNLLPGTADASFEGDRGNWYSLGGYFQYNSRASTGETQPTSATALSLTNLKDGYGLLTKGLTIASISPSSPAATLTITTTDKHALSTGGVVTITGVKPTIFNLSSQTITKISDTQFSIPAAVTNTFTVSSFANTSGSTYTTVDTGTYTHGLVAGDTVTITGSANFNGTWTVLSSPAPVDSSTHTFAIPVKPASGWYTAQKGTGTSTINVEGSVVVSSAYSNPTIKSYGAESSTEETLGKLIPISPGVPYLFSGWAKALDTNAHTTNACTITAQINWYDAQGNFLSNATAGTTVTLVKGSPGLWYKFESNTSYAAAYSPANAAYVGIYISTAGLISNTTTSARDSIALDYFSFNVYPSLVASINYGIGDFVYEDPRDVKVTIRGARTNYINNPNFEEGISSWNVISPSSGTFVQDFTQTPPYSGGATVAKFNGVGSVLYSDWVKNLTPSTYYTFSIYVKSASAVGVKAAIEFNAPQKLSDQANASTDAGGSYFSPTPYKTYSSEVSLTAGGDWTRISVTALSPEYFGPNGLPSAVVSLEFTSTPSGNWWVDAAMLEESITPGLYFQGNGGPPAATSELVTKDYIYPSDCAWETRLRTNFVSNPSFEVDASNWGVTAGTGTISASTAQKKFGTNSGAVAYTTASTTAYTSVTLPTKITGGSTFVSPNVGDVVSGSVYVYATVAGKFQLNITSAGSYSVLGSNPADYVYAQTGNWVRLDKSIILNTSIFSSPSVTFAVKFTADSGTTGTWYLDGAQLEIGDIVSAYVDTSNGNSYTALTGGGYATNSTMSGIGRSYYWPNKTTKFSRLAKTINNYLPLGSTYTLQYGLPNTPVNETAGSLVTSSLFANGIYGWKAVAATNLSTLTSTTLSSTGAPTIARHIGSGSLAKIDSNYYSGAFTPNLISLTNTNNKAYFGIQQSTVKVHPGTAYKLSTALSFTDVASLFTPSYVVTWYDKAKTELSTVKVTDTTSVTIPSVSTTNGSYNVTYSIDPVTGYKGATPLEGDKVTGYPASSAYITVTDVVVNTTTNVVTITTDTPSTATGTSTLTFINYRALTYASGSALIDSSTPYLRAIGSWGEFAKRVESPTNAAYATISVVINAHYPSSTNKVYLSRVIATPNYSNTPV